MIAVAGCTLPEAPGNLSWDTQLYVPLGIRTYSLNDLVDSSSVFLGEDSLLYYAAFTELKIPISDSLGIGPVIDTLIKPTWISDTTSFRPLIGYRHRLLAATIAHGTLWLGVENTSDVSDMARAVLPNIVNPQGDTLIFERYTAAHTRIDTVYNLAGYVIRFEDTSPQWLETRLHSTGLSEIHAYVQTDRFSFRYYTGRLDNLSLDVLANGEALERPPEGWESVHPTIVDAYIHVVRGITGATADTDLDFSTWDGGHLLASANLLGSSLQLDQDTSLVLHGLAHLMAVYPDSVSSEGKITLNGLVENVQPTDTIRLKVEGRAYLSFTLDPLHAPTEVQRVETEDIKDIQTGWIKVRIWNRLPVGGRAFLVWDRDSTRVLENSSAAVDTVLDLQILRPTVINGRAQNETYTDFTLMLDDSLLEYFRRPLFFSRLDITLPGAGNDTLIAHAADYIKVQPIAEITYRIDMGNDE